MSEIHLRLGSGVKEDSHRCLLCPAKGKPWGQTALFVRLNSHGDSDVLNLAILVSTVSHKVMPPVLKIEISKQGLLNANTTNENFRKELLACRF